MKRFVVLMIIAFGVMGGIARATVFADTLRLDKLERQWCEGQVASRDAIREFRSLAWDDSLGEDDRLRARLYAMLCSANCYNMIDTRNDFRALDSATTETTPENKLLMDYVRVALEGCDGPRGEAIRSLEVLLLEHPDVPFARPVMQSIARFYKDLGQPAEMFHWQDQSLIYVEETTQTQTLQAKIYIENFRLDKLDAMVARIQRESVHPELDAFYQYLHGFQMLYGSFDDDAIESFETALLIDPDHPLNIPARCKLASLYWETYKPEDCLETLDELLARLDPNLDFKRWDEGITYKANRLRELGRYRDSIMTIFELDRPGWNSDQHQKATSGIAEYFHTALRQLNRLDQSEHGMDEGFLELLELRRREALADLTENIETWRPVSVLFVYNFHGMHKELIEYGKWALENRHLDMVTTRRVLMFTGMSYAYSAEPADRQEATRLFELLANLDRDTRTILNSSADNYYLMERDRHVLSAFTWLIHMHLIQGNEANANFYFDRMQNEVAWSRHKAEMVERYRNRLGR